MATFNVDSLDFVDDEEARFGAGPDFAARFSSGNNRFELEDLTNAAIGYIPKNVGADLVGGKIAETVADGKALADDGQTYDDPQEAVDNATDWVKIGPGDFGDTNLEVRTSGIMVTGVGHSTHLNSVDTYGSNLTVKDLSVGRGGINAADDTQSNILFDNILARNDDKKGVGIDINGTYVVVHDCEVYGFDNATNQRTNTVRTAIVNCYSEDAGGNAFQPNGDDNICAFNRIINAGEHGLDFRVNDGIVIGNIIINSGNDGLVNNHNDCIIANNRVYGSATGTDVIDSGAGTTLDGNQTG